MKRTILSTALLVAITAVGASGCGTLDSGGNAKIESKGDNKPAAGKSEDTTDQDQGDPTAIRPTKDDIGLALVVKSKECFGSAGCNITYGVRVKWTGTPDEHPDGRYDVKYAVTGGDSGPQSETLTVYKNGKYDVPYDNFLSTTSQYTKPGVRVVHISKHVGY